MIFRETVMGMMGERRLTGRVDAGWTAAVFHLGTGSLWVADVADAGPAGLGLQLDAPIERGDLLEIALRDARGRQATVAGTVTFAPRALDQRFGVLLTRLAADYIELLIAAFQADILATATRRTRQVDYGLAHVTPLPVSDRKEGKEERDSGGWRTRKLAEVIPYRRGALAGTLLPEIHSPRRRASAD